MAADVVPMSDQVKNVVHGSQCAMVVPGVLLASSAGMLCYRGMTEDHFDLPLNGFLFNILLQMLPLAALKVKIYSCSDRVSLVPLVLVKTLLMHVAMLGLRITSQVIQQTHLGKIQFAADVAAVVGALVVLNSVFAFPIAPARMIEHRDVRSLTLMAMGVALAFEAFYVYVEPSWMGEATKFYIRDGLQVQKVLFVAANYVDIVAFMPVVYRLYQVENELDDCAIGATVSSETRRQVQLFFAFMCSFYLWEDVIEPCMSLQDEPLALAAHVAHFVLLLDFAGFFIFQVQTPATAGMREKGEQMQGLLEEGGFDDD